MPPAYDVFVRAEKGTLPFAKERRAARYLVGDFRHDGSYLTFHDVREAAGDPLPIPVTFGINHDRVRSWTAEKVNPDGSPLGPDDR